MGSSESKPAAVVNHDDKLEENSSLVVRCAETLGGLAMIGAGGLALSFHWPIVLASALMSAGLNSTHHGLFSSSSHNTLSNKSTHEFMKDAGFGALSGALTSTVGLYMPPLLLHHHFSHLLTSMTSGALTGLTSKCLDDFRNKDDDLRLIYDVNNNSSKSISSIIKDLIMNNEWTSNAFIGLLDGLFNYSSFSLPFNKYLSINNSANVLLNPCARAALSDISVQSMQLINGQRQHIDSRRVLNYATRVALVTLAQEIFPLFYLNNITKTKFVPHFNQEAFHMLNDKLFKKLTSLTSSSSSDEEIRDHVDTDEWILIDKEEEEEEEEEEDEETYLVYDYESLKKQKAANAC
jgi:hypothetical protein